MFNFLHTYQVGKTNKCQIPTEGGGTVLVSVRVNKGGQRPRDQNKKLLRRQIPSSSLLAPCCKLGSKRRRL